jgi:hypothetical protein
MDVVAYFESTEEILCAICGLGRLPYVKLRG